MVPCLGSVILERGCVADAGSIRLPIAELDINSFHFTLKISHDFGTIETQTTMLYHVKKI